MKVGNKLLNRIVAVGMLAVVLFCTFSLSEPEVAKAATYSYTWTESWRGDKGNTWTVSLNPVGGKGSQFFVTTNVEHTSTTFYIIVPENSFSVNWSQLKKGSTSVSNDTSDCTGYIIIDDKKYYYYVRGYGYPNPENGKDYYTFNWSGASKVYSYSSTNSKYTDEDFVRLFITGKVPVDCEILDGVTSTDESTWKGSRENPIEDSNIGTLLLDRSKCYWTEGGEQPTVQRISWKNKTDTGFSLNNNKYALTRIEVKIGNRVTYFGDVEHHGTGKEVDNFGKVYPFKYVNPKDNPYDFSFTEMLTASQTDLEKYNPAMLEHEYDLYFRVICSDAIGTSAKYYVGKWTRYRCTDDPKQKGDNESDNGHFNENGEWEKDKDTDVDSGGIGNVKDEDEKKDDFNNFTDSENWKDWLNEGGLDLDSAKAFISQIAEVPKMIGDIFSFLPKWVLYSFALGFGLIPVVIVIKFLRG